MIAHRGASAVRLENTIEACRLAVEAGAPMLEVDVQLAKDGELVVFHDRDLVRLGGGDRRAVEQLESRELADVELALMRADGRETLRGRATTLADLLAALPPAYPVDVEIKRFAADYSWLASAVVRALAERPNVLVSSFDWQALADVRTLLPDLQVAPIADRQVEPVLDAAQKLDAWSIHVHRRLAGADLAAAARAAGRPLLVYTVNDVDEARALFALGVSGVFTDDPQRLIRELRDERGAGGGAPCPSRGRGTGG